MSATTPIIIRHSSEDVENVMDDIFSEDLDAFNTPIGTYTPFFLEIFIYSTLSI